MYINIYNYIQNVHIYTYILLSFVKLLFNKKKNNNNNEKT